MAILGKMLFSADTRMDTAFLQSSYKIDRRIKPAGSGGRLGRRRNRGGLSRPVRGALIFFAKSCGRSAPVQIEIIDQEPIRNGMILKIGHCMSDLGSPF